MYDQSSTHEIQTMGIQIIKRGGKRLGAGPKPQGMKDTCVSLDQASKTILTKLGGGKLSPGIRMAAARVGRLRLAGYARREDLDKLHLELEAWADGIAVWINEEQQP
jgi:hypothetical protein